ncbi:hypothetical protein R1521_09465 [Rhizobium brockwellii]|uniref:AB hydrolase-1 domain-containing protein n=1 Tax=Rhizobium brockwellii TaxID=3019932 RepID=A0ABU3YIP9_9HYPH|nr:alpha/beta fold hydrolase [Rhizobium brockwellii]MDV4178733.1 hypothetical protein [Rhizobium brockwellii]MDV4185731.1 hypothetical protein [Rhizobium brockwellii]
MFLLERYLRRKEEELALVDEDQKDCGRFRLGAFTGSGEDEFDSVESMSAAVQHAVDRADEFYAGTSDETSFRVEGTCLTYKSVFADGSANDSVHVDVYSRGQSRERAVIVVPHWNSAPGAYAAIGTVLSFAGFTAYVVTLPHHGSRGASDAPRIANDFLNADLGVAIRSVRQSVCDIRSLISWISGNGAKQIHVVGVSLGSCIASLTTAFDSRVSRGCLLLTAGDFAETIWRGRATRHIRASIDGHIDLARLRQIWAILSPSNFVGRFRENHSRLLMISGKIDEVVPYDTASRFVDELRAVETNPEWLILPCGHYTLSYFPFSWLSLIQTIRFLRAD